METIPGIGNRTSRICNWCSGRSYSYATSATTGSINNSNRFSNCNRFSFSHFNFLGCLTCSIDIGQWMLDTCANNC
jgi:hypothetical protein